jgi:hypothetical protein
MRKFAFGIIFLITFSFAQAGENEMHLIQPKAINLKLLHLQRVDGTAAKFKGKVWIAGTFIGRWADYGEQNRTLEYLLVPDAASIAKLPYFAHIDSQYHINYRVIKIYPKNGKTALRMSVGEDKAKRLLQHKIGKVKATGKFLIEAYEVGVECDAPWASANIIGFEKPDNLAANLNAPEGC